MRHASALLVVGCGADEGGNTNLGLGGAQDFEAQGFFAEDPRPAD